MTSKTNIVAVVLATASFGAVAIGLGWVPKAEIPGITQAFAGEPAPETLGRIEAESLARRYAMEQIGRREERGKGLITLNGERLSAESFEVKESIEYGPGPAERTLAIGTYRVQHEGGQSGAWLFVLVLPEVEERSVPGFSLRVTVVVSSTTGALLNVSSQTAPAILP